MIYNRTTILGKTKEYGRIQQKTIKQNTSRVCAQAGFNAKCKRVRGEILVHVLGKVKFAFIVRVHSFLNSP